MKKNILLISLILFSIFLFSCVENKNKKDEVVVKNVVEAFYINLNSRDFSSIKEISTPRMGVFIDFISDIGDNLVTYKKYEIIDISLNANNAVVLVEGEDVFGNIVDFKWNLVRVENKWLLDMFSGDDDQEILSDKHIEFTKRKIEEDD